MSFLQSLIDVVADLFSTEPNVSSRRTYNFEYVTHTEAEDEISIKTDSHSFNNLSSLYVPDGNLEDFD